MYLHVYVFLIVRFYFYPSYVSTLCKESNISPRIVRKNSSLFPQEHHFPFLDSWFSCFLPTYLWITWIFSRHLCHYIHHFPSIRSAIIIYFVILTRSKLLVLALRLVKAIYSCACSIARLFFFPYITGYFPWN